MGASRVAGALRMAAVAVQRSKTALGAARAMGQGAGRAPRLPSARSLVTRAPLSPYLPSLENSRNTSTDCCDTVSLRGHRGAAI
jgi:hypothetical protein